MSDSERMPYNSEASLDTTTIVLMADVDALQAVLEEHHVELSPIRGAPSGQHPICVDLWHVDAGRPATGAIDQHAWLETAASATTALAASWAGGVAGSAMGAVRGAAAGALMATPFGPIASYWGAAAGWVAGGAWGGGAAASTGSREGAAFGAEAGRRWSEAVSRMLGTYDEVLLAVPNAICPGNKSRPCMFVLGMWTNSSIAIWGDRVMRCGYRKRWAEISRHGFARYDVVAETGTVSLSAVLASPTPDRWRSPDAQLNGYRLLFAQPLLGHLENGAFAVTWLDRSLMNDSVRWTPVSGRVELARGVIAGLPTGAFDVRELSPDHPWGAFQARGVQSGVTFPVHLSEADVL